MKLRNKKTGEIVDLTEGLIRDARHGSTIEIKPVAISNKEGYVYASLAELNEEWEDVPEEPKEYWYISDFGFIFNHEINERTVKSTIEEMKSIGNYFETKEEAEKAVRKLKAWKRLKDKGFRFDNFVRNAIYYKLSDEEIEKDNVLEDLDLLFGGEE